jgi:soluble lytic murein transglycosylase
LSRDDQNEEAIKRYRDLLKRFPRASEAEEARYLIGRLYYAQGKWQFAEQAYSDYLQLYEKNAKHRGRFTNAASYERAVTRLAAGKAALAALDFAALVRASKDVYTRAQLLELLGASLSVGNPQQAPHPLRQAMEIWPLSLPAALAALRLTALHAPLPSQPVDGAPPAPPLAVRLPDDVQLLHRLGFDALAAETLSERRRSFAEQFGSRASEAMCQAYALLDDAQQRYRFARAKVKPSVLLSLPKPSNRWAWDCLFPRPHQAVVAQAEQRYGVSATLLYAVMRRESAFRADALSDAGAQGLMQLMPATAEKVSAQANLECDASELLAPQFNIQLAAKYLHTLSDSFAHQGPLLLAAYNAGPAVVSRWLEHGETLPLDVWIARIPYAETRTYVSQVITNWIRYAALAGAPPPELQLTIPLGLRAASDAF